jgi:hypothetical protein
VCRQTLGDEAVIDRQEGTMAITFTRSIGMLLLGLWLILSGVAGLAAFVLPSPIMPVLALLAGVLILIGR